ncbi:Prp39p [Saccharomyces eubayanus]|uniref:Prp39p n=1 Tax=Saccharomyces eubayanus TaxID=1080349 RepID=UPI0006C5CD19|nr:PRP39-like protein [Saccharomyces eubayanus]KOG97307.1 PRP39-like protein [Saccharomyces eubayanus]
MTDETNFTIEVIEPRADALRGLDSLFLQDNAALVQTYRNMDWSDISSLTQMVDVIEQTVVKYGDPNDSIKLALETILWQILRKYPLLFGFWKRFTTIEYQLFGLKKSIEVLATSVKWFPTSLELWCDYLNVLCVNNPNEKDFIRNNFHIAKDLIGEQFLSHPFWDKFIEFEVRQENWENVQTIYEYIIEIPLHQYARFFTSYKKLLNERNFKPKRDIDTVLRRTQTIVNEIWQFESKIKQPFFNLGQVLQDDLKNWSQYLNFVTNPSKSLDKKFIMSIFDRCLIPCVYNEKVWLMYINWLTREDSYEITVGIYQKASKVLPLDFKTLRYDFIKYLKKNYRLNNVLFSKIFNETVSHFLNIWPNDVSLMTEYICMWKRHSFKNSLDQPPREILEKQTSFAKILETSITNYLTKQTDPRVHLQTLINDKNLSIVVVELIKTTWLVLKNNMQTRKYFNFYQKNSLIKDSVPFWLTYYKFEKSNVNFTRLNKFIKELGVEIYLPTTIMNDILTDYKTFYLMHSNIVAYETSTLDSNDFDPILYPEMKISNPQYEPVAGVKPNAEWYKRTEWKEAGHVGIMIERPQISNSIIECNSRNLVQKPITLPNFRNLEKINQVKINDLYTEEFLKERK